MSDRHLRGPYGPEGAFAAAPACRRAEPEPPSVSDLSAAFEAARNRVEATQPTQTELAASRVRCHVADAGSSLCAAVVVCEDMALLERLLLCIESVKLAQTMLRKTKSSCE